MEICLHDYGFLRFFRSKFIKNLKAEVPEKDYDRTILSFGNAFVSRNSILLNKRNFDWNITYVHFSGNCSEFIATQQVHRVCLFSG